MRKKRFISILNEVKYLGFEPNFSNKISVFNIFFLKYFINILFSKFSPSSKNPI